MERRLEGGIGVSTDNVKHLGTVEHKLLKYSLTLLFDSADLIHSDVANFLEFC